MKFHLYAVICSYHTENKWHFVRKLFITSAFIFLLSFEATVTVKLNDGRVIRETSDKLDTKKAASFQAAERAYNVLLGGQ